MWQMVARQVLLLIDLNQQARERTAALMKQYQDVPMALADATLVALAEQLQVDAIFTFDSDFKVYRLNGRRAFKLVPEAR